MSNSSKDTLRQYRAVIQDCRCVFEKKLKDYGASWHVFRMLSIVDQIFIKAWRIRQIQEQQKAIIEDSIEDEFKGIVNYAIIALIQVERGFNADIEPEAEIVMAAYNKAAETVETLMLKKNHDYGEAWRHMSLVSFVDLILVKLLRIRQIESNDGQTIASEGVEANIHDIMNYAVFALIHINEQL
jgi:hypothetical protein